jgi:hypothetical protein
MDLYKELNLTPVRSEPSVWVSRLVILEKLSPEPAIIRDIPLARGLNIVWAEEPEDDNPPSEISGHSAGKTTFCRFLRYVLGERTFGTRPNMELICKALPDGYVAAEIHVAGKLWAVRRPFGSGRMSYIEQNATIEELLQQRTSAVSQEEYPKKLGLENLLNALESGRIVRTDETIQWGHVLAWCSRDQEARFQNIYDWRSSRSQSEAPGFKRSREGPLFVMRAALGLFLPDELKGEEKLAALQREKERLEKKLEKKRQEPDFWVNRYDHELRRLLVPQLPDEQGIDVLPLHSNDLLPDLHQLTNGAASQIEQTIHDHEIELSDIQKRIDEVGTQIGLKQREYEQQDILFDINTTAGKELDSGLSKRQEQRKAFEDLQNSECPLGNVVFRDCTHIQERQRVLHITELQDAHAMEQAEARRVEEQQRVEKDKAELRNVIEILKRQMSDLHGKRDSIGKEVLEKRQELNDLRHAREELETWTQRRDIGAGYEEILSLQQKLGSTSLEIEKLERELTDLLLQHDSNRDLLNSIFSGAVRAVLPSGGYNGEVSLSSRELSFHVAHETAMSGEAVETLSVLLSDIAAVMYTTISDKAHLPGFMLHDSPREADLGLRIYRSFIRFVVTLQKHFEGADACPFQYILTTTTPPPKELQTTEFMKLRLNAAHPEGLLLKRNVATASKMMGPQLLP